MAIQKVINLIIPLLNNWGYPIIFIAALLEASPLIGFVVPGQTLVILGGFFSRLGILSLEKIIWISALGAVLGDLIGYILGRRYGDSFMIKFGKYFLYKEEYHKTTKKLIKGHAGKTIIIGRFNPLSRAIVPFVAGVSKVNFFNFMLYNIIGGMTWAIAFVMIGYIFGGSYELASKYLGDISLVIFILLILGIYIYESAKRRKKYINRKKK